MDSVVSSDDDLSAFLAGLRQRYNLDAVPASAVSPAAVSTAGQAAADAASGSTVAEPDEREPEIPGPSTDAAILGLHPAFRGSFTTGATSPSLKSGQPTATQAQTAAAAGRDEDQLGTTAGRYAGEQHAADAAAAASPAQSESGSCTTPQQQLAAPVQQGPAARQAQHPATPTDVSIRAACSWAAAGQGAAEGAGAVAAAASPHSTAAMPGAWHAAQHTSTGSVLREQSAAGRPAPHAAAADVAGIDSDSSSPGSVVKPLLGAFSAVADTAAHAAGPQQQQQQQHEEGSSSEVTLQSLLDSPKHSRQPREQRQHHHEQPSPRQQEHHPAVQSPQQQKQQHRQQQQQPQAPPAQAPASPPRPLLGAWAARVAAARNPSPAHPAAPTAGPGPSSPATAAQSTHAGASPPPSSSSSSSSAAAAAASGDEVKQLHAETAAGPDVEATAQAAPAAAAATDAAAAEQHSTASGSVASEKQQQQPQPQPQQQQELAQPKPQQQELQQQQQEVDQVLRSQQAGPAVDWQRLSGQLSAEGFGHLPLLQDGELMAEPKLPELFDTLCKVLHEYQRRDSLMQQLLSERDEMRRASRRSSTESSKLERERDEALRAVNKLKAELADMKSVQVPAIEAQHKESLAKLSSEVSRLKHACKEAEAAAAAAQAEAAEASTQSTLQAQLHQAVRDRERLRVECERLESEHSRQKPFIKELEKEASAARSASRQAADQAGLLERQLRQLKQQHEEEQVALTAELNKARHAIREAEQQLSALRADTAAGSSDAPELLRQLAAERAQHDDQQAHLSSELHNLRQQLLQLQQAAAKAEESAKADRVTAAHAEKQLAQQERQHKAYAGKLNAEVRQARESVQLLQAKFQQVEAAAGDQASAATAAEAAAKESADRAATAGAELDKLRAASLQQQQHLSELLQESKSALSECQQQLASTQGDLRRLRAAAGLAEATAGVAGLTVPAAAVAAAEGSAADAAALTAQASSSSSRLALQAQGSARVVLPGSDSSSSIGQEASAASLAAAAAAAGAAGGSAADLAAALSRAVAAEAGLADAEANVVGLRYRCMQLEMSCSRREQELDSLRDKLAHKVTREERKLARDKTVYQRIKQAYAASGGAAAGRRAAQAAAGGSNSNAPWSAVVEVGPGAGGAAARCSNAAGAVAAAARELRPVELVGIYEGQKEALEKELGAARAEVRVLSGQLRDAQNLLISRDRAAAVAAAAAGFKPGPLSAKLGDPAAAAAAQKKAAELQRELCSVRAEAASALREAAKRLAETKAETSQLRGDVNALQEELDNRPTAADQRRLQREVDLLQRKIATLRRQAAADQPGGSAAAGEDSLAAAAAAAGDVWGVDDTGRGQGGSRGRGTKTAIERDKALARLGLHVVEEFPRDVLVDIVQDMCIVLELRDATLLVPSLKKVAAVAAAIPSVEAFVAQVCEVVLREGLAFTPAEVQDAGLGPKCVPQVLRHWLALLRQGELLMQFVRELQQLLAQRCNGGGQLLAAAPATAGDMGRTQQLAQLLLQEVQALLQVESEAVAASDVLGAAKGLLVDQPEGLLQRLVLQVMQLMGVEQLDGLPATVNRVYMHYTELLNFLRAVVSLLALPHDSGPNTVMAALAKLLEQSARPPSKVRQAAAELQAAAGLHHQPDDQQQQQWRQQQAADGLTPEGVAAAEQLSGLLRALGAADEQQAAERHREMVTRLRRLDQVLPKYQSVVSQLYDRLRVVALDELLPAVDRLLQQIA